MNEEEVRAGEQQERAPRAARGGVLTTVSGVRKLGGMMGIVQGVPSAHISNVGVLDLREVDPSLVEQIENISTVGVLILDRAAGPCLAHAKLANIGSLIEAGRDEKINVQPCREFSRASLEAMEPGQKVIQVGVLVFRPDTPAALVLEKLASLRVIGVLVATASVQGALLSRAQVVGASVTLPESAGPLVTAIGRTRLTRGYLSYLQDGTVYLNLGTTEVAEDAGLELLQSRIGVYYNVGDTVGPPLLLDLLKARCPASYGSFHEGLVMVSTP